MTPENHPPLLSVTELGKHFGGLQAVDGLDFEVRAGEIVGMIGPNGAGKSTTFNIVAGALAPSRGELVFAGSPVTGLPAHAMAARGVVRTFQHNKPFAGMSLRDNVMTGLHNALRGPLWRVLLGAPSGARAERDAAARADELIAFVGLSDARDVEVAALSFGQGRLLEIARALAAGPRLIMFDEPAAGLTPDECVRLAAIVRQVAGRGIAVLLIEHDMRFLLALADRVMVLNFGRKIAEGTPAEIQADEAVIDAYLGNLRVLGGA